MSKSEVKTLVIAGVSCVIVAKAQFATAQPFAELSFASDSPEGDRLTVRTAYAFNGTSIAGITLVAQYGSGKERQYVAIPRTQTDSDGNEVPVPLYLRGSVDEGVLDFVHAHGYSRPVRLSANRGSGFDAKVQVPCAKASWEWLRDGLTSKATSHRGRVFAECARELLSALVASEGKAGSVTITWDDIPTGSVPESEESEESGEASESA